MVFTGNGKGKTTAALGASLRAVGRGQKVLFVQFIKGPWKSGEDFIAVFKRDKLQSSSWWNVSGASVGGVPQPFTLKKMGLGFVGILGDSLPFEDHVAAAKKALSYIREEMGKYDMVVMDEVNVAVSLKLLRAGEVLEVAQAMPSNKIVVMTGRGAPKEFIDAADLVTEMKEVKHPYNDGKVGKMNVEF